MSLPFIPITGAFLLGHLGFLSWLDTTKCLDPKPALVKRTNIVPTLIAGVSKPAITLSNSSLMSASFWRNLFTGWSRSRNCWNGFQVGFTIWHPKKAWDEKLTAGKKDLGPRGLTDEDCNETLVCLCPSFLYPHLLWEKRPLQLRRMLLYSIVAPQSCSKASLLRVQSPLSQELKWREKSFESIIKVLRRRYHASMYCRALCWCREVIVQIVAALLWQNHCWVLRCMQKTPAKSRLKVDNETQSIWVWYRKMANLSH